MEPNTRIGTLAIIGAGLIGGSFALALKAAGRVERVLGVGRSLDSLEQAKALSVIDEVATMEQAAQEADLILVAVPVGSFANVFATLKPHLTDRVILTDAGSTKGNVVKVARKFLQERVSQFVPAHPMAGSHLCGPQAARADLYVDRKLILCPLPENDPETVSVVESMWRACGARILEMPWEQHDEAVAAISHLPHWLASMYVYQITQSADADVKFEVAGTGFADFTRVAQGSDEMWRDIFMVNRDAVCSQLAEFEAQLAQARKALEREDFDWIVQMLRVSAKARQDWEKQR